MRLIGKRFENSLATMVELLDAETALNRSRALLVENESNYALATGEALPCCRDIPEGGCEMKRFSGAIPLLLIAAMLSVTGCGKSEQKRAATEAPPVVKGVAVEV